MKAKTFATDRTDGLQGGLCKPDPALDAGSLPNTSRRLEATTTCPAAFALMLGESAVASCGHPFSGGLSGYVLPIAAVSKCCKILLLFDDLVGAAKQRERDHDADRFCG